MPLLTPAGPLLQPIDAPAAGAAPLAGRQATDDGFTQPNLDQIWEAGRTLVAAAIEAAAVGVGRHSSAQPLSDKGHIAVQLITDCEAHVPVAN